MQSASLPHALLRPALVSLALVHLLVAFGCAVRPVHPVRDPGKVATRPAPERPAPPPSRPPADEPAIEDEGEPVDAAALPDRLPAGDDVDEDAPLTDDNTPIEDPVTASPLDRLADVAPPDLTAAELERERDRAEGAEPSFDIPIELSEPVLAWVDLYSGRFRDSFAASLRRSGRYMGMFRRIFREAGVPEDMVYMAHVESGYKTSAYSRAHARGIFQFITSTARNYGLRVDYWVDERSDPEKSARAAAAYMKKLYEDFGDWHLALAAYNAGEGKVQRGLTATGLDDFWGLSRTRYLRRETKNHVPAVLAAAWISKQPTKYGFADVELETPIDYDTIAVEGAADLRVLARCAETDLTTMKELNPALRRYQTPPGATTEVRVPAGMGELASATLAGIAPEDRVLFARYRVERGDSLSLIAERHRVSVRDLQAANQLGGRTLIRVGQMLRIPNTSAAGYADLDRGFAAPQPGDGEVLTYRVRRGDTLSSIARRYRTTPQAIAAANGMSLHKTLFVGERLKVVTGVLTAGDAQDIAQAGSQKVVHTVRRGDTLWRIATRYGTSVDELCSLNRIHSRAVLHPGTRLTVGYK